MTTLITKAISGETYAAWYDETHVDLPLRAPFHHPAWLEATARGTGMKPVYAGLFRRNEMIGAVPGHLFRRGPVQIYGSPMRGTMTSYLGPIGVGLGETPEELIDIITACSQFVRREWRVLYTRFTLRNAPAGGKLPLGDDWSQQRPGSYRLSLDAGVEMLWKGLKSDCRRNIKKGRQAGIEIVPLEDPHYYYKMLEETFRRHNSTSTHGKEFFGELIGRLVPAGALWPWGARYEGQIIAAGLFLHDDREVHFLSGASLPEFGSLPTSYLLHWHAIEKGVEAGLRVFNSDASRIRSIDQFKESFRPAYERRYTLIWAPQLVYRARKLAIAGYHRLRHWKARLAPRHRVHG